MKKITRHEEKHIISLKFIYRQYRKQEMLNFLGKVNLGILSNNLKN